MGAGIAASPHVRRAKDMPVFATWFLLPEGRSNPSFDPGSPAQASLPFEPLPRKRDLTDLPICNPEDCRSFNPSGLSIGAEALLV
jgi:hypothetical protein